MYYYDIRISSVYFLRKPIPKRKSIHRIWIIHLKRQGNEKKRKIIFADQFIICRVGNQFLSIFKDYLITTKCYLLRIYPRKQIGYIYHRFSVYFIMLQNIKAYTHSILIHKSTDWYTDTYNTDRHIHHTSKHLPTIFHFRFE